MRELTLHLLDIAENSVSAGANNIYIFLEEDIIRDRLRMSIQDNGRGMDAETVTKVIDPFYTTRTTRHVGLGIPLLKEAAEMCNGSFKITSSPGKGTCVEVEFQHSHIDRMPLGDITNTILNLIVSYPGIFWKFIYRVNDKEFIFDDQEIKAELEGISLTEPDIIAFIRKLLVSGVAEIKPTPV